MWQWTIWKDVEESGQSTVVVLKTLILEASNKFPTEVCRICLAMSNT